MYENATETNLKEIRQRRPTDVCWESTYRLMLPPLYLLYILSQTTKTSSARAASLRYQYSLIAVYCRLSVWETDSCWTAPIGDGTAPCSNRDNDISQQL